MHGQVFCTDIFLNLNTSVGRNYTDSITPNGSYKSMSGLGRKEDSFLNSYWEITREDNE